MNKIGKAIKFYVLATSLKNTIRTGWLKYHVSKERLESVAEHIYGTCILAISIDSEFDTGVDLNKVLKMLVLHELEEVIIGDITPYDNVTKEEKLGKGKEAVDKILDGLVKKEECISLLDEFNAHITKESKYAFFCDKLEACLQAKIYTEENACDIFSEENKEFMNHPKLKQLIKNGAGNLSDLFIEYDIDKFDDLFKEIAKYIKENDISNK